MLEKIYKFAMVKMAAKLRLRSAGRRKIIS